MAGSDFIWRFTPSRTEPRLLEEIFVQRRDLLADIVERVRESAVTGNKHQILLIGPRGIGKTHLIALLHHRIAQDPALSDRVRIAWFLEDETITSFVQLLKRTYELLSEEYPAEFPRDWLDGLLDQSPARILKALETTLIDKFRDRTLLLFIENLDLIFEGLGDAGQTQWRSFLQTHPFTSIVGTSQRLFKDVQVREQPFFGFFATEHLKPLPTPDAVDLLRRIASHREQPDLLAFLATPEGRSRVRAIHHLAGGNHRIYIVLSGFITRESLDELAGPFEKMADEMTPYYQERMRWLSPQQRQIVEYLCSRDETCTPKEIARHLLATENTVSSQLKKLAELGYVLRSPRGRESLYELAEPLMRLASEVKEKRRKPLRLLVNFLRVWYRPDVLPQLLDRAGTPSLRMHIQAAISELLVSPDPRVKVLEAEIEKAKEENRLEDLHQLLEEQAQTRGTARSWLELGIYHRKLKKYDAELTCYGRALEIDPQYATAWNNKGWALNELRRYEESITCLDKALEIDPQLAAVWNNKGFALNRLRRYEESITCLDKALEIDPQHAAAWNNKGSGLNESGRYEESITCLDKALEIDPQLAVAWHNKGSALNELRRYEESITCLDRALEIDPQYATAWSNKGFALNELRRYEEAIACYDRALEIDPQLAAWHNKGAALYGLRRYEEAIACYDRALEIDPQYATAWHNKGWALDELRRYEEAIACYDKALEIDPQDAIAWNDRGWALSRLRRYEEAIACYDMSLEIDPQYALAWKNKGLSLRKLGREESARTCHERVLALESKDPSQLFPRCQSSLALRRWQEALATLREAFHLRPRDMTHAVGAILELILQLSEEDSLQRHLAELIGIYAEAGTLTHLGSGLVGSLRWMAAERIDARTLEAWRAAWLELGAGHAELEVPLRIFRVGIEYLIRGDEKVLLDLVSVERKIVRQALGLDGAEGDE